jgi:hypothetical protein
MSASEYAVAFDNCNDLPNFCGMSPMRTPFCVVAPAGFYLAAAMMLTSRSR